MGVESPQSEAPLQDQWIPVQWKLPQLEVPLQDEWVPPQLEVLLYGE